MFLFFNVAIYPAFMRVFAILAFNDYVLFVLNLNPETGNAVLKPLAREQKPESLPLSKSSLGTPPGGVLAYALSLLIVWHVGGYLSARKIQHNSYAISYLRINPLVWFLENCGTAPSKDKDGEKSPSAA